MHSWCDDGNDDRDNDDDEWTGMIGDPHDEREYGLVPG